MLVYGDLGREESAASIHGSIHDLMASCAVMPAGLQRHEKLVRAFLMTGELVQALVDEEFAARGQDDLSSLHESGSRLLLAQARAILASWQNGFGGSLAAPEDWAVLLKHLPDGGMLRIKQAEGYAFYALYPEAYLQAALRSELGPDTVVIGIRNIGMSLAALVAAALGSGPPYTVRPTGHPFSRRIRLGQALSRRLLEPRSATFAIVDEGPGLSGSSFGSVADWLEENGVAPDAIHFFPSHPGNLGPHASPSHKVRWERQPRHSVSFDDIFLRPRDPVSNLQAWASNVVGQTATGWQDVSGGAWRSMRYSEPSAWPPVHLPMEKRKFLMKDESKTWHVKFSGLGRPVSEKLKKGYVLSEAGFTPRVVGACHGFLVEEWMNGRPLDLQTFPASRMVDQLGRYLSFRAARLKPANEGASLADLYRMTLFNVGEAASPGTAEKLRRLLPSPEPLTHRLRPIDTDSRLHTWEWLVAPDGRMIKTDALDHSGAHDLVGCQDVAWDVAGAYVEFDLPPEHRDRLAEKIMSTVDCDLDRDVLLAFEACYLGFQIGLWWQAAAATTGDERLRIKRTIQRYLDRLERLFIR